MPSAGYVLTGGRSSRMGSDKALLPLGGRTLVEHVSAAVASAAGSVTLVGNAGRYGFLGIPAIDDRHPGCGPLSGIQAALESSSAEWNLIVACDMPHIGADFLKWLLEKAPCASADIVMPIGPSGLPEPLCAVYRSSCLPAIDRALAARRYKVADVLRELVVQSLPVSAELLDNANTPADWARILDRTEVGID